MALAASSLFTNETKAKPRDWRVSLSFARYTREMRPKGLKRSCRSASVVFSEMLVTRMVLRSSMRRSGLTPLAIAARAEGGTYFPPEAAPPPAPTTFQPPPAAPSSFPSTPYLRSSWRFCCLAQNSLRFDERSLAASSSCMSLSANGSSMKMSSLERMVERWAPSAPSLRAFPNFFHLRRSSTALASRTFCVTTLTLVMVLSSCFGFAGC
mmetsp:Transcript_12839/g.30328  ORF Transcript_12839/g.30328 Transcript_12839/m.30328 type:complete len:210 (+) Transcript_12839:1342-1971(+)